MNGLRLIRATEAPTRTVVKKRPEAVLKASLTAKLRKTPRVVTWVNETDDNNFRGWHRVPTKEVSSND